MLDALYVNCVIIMLDMITFGVYSSCVMSCILHDIAFALK